MEKERIRKFKNRQKRLVKKIENKTGLKLKKIGYKEYLPGAEYDDDTEKIKFKDNVQICIPGADIIPNKKIWPNVRKVSKHRVKIIIEFNRKIYPSDRKILNKILKTQYYINKNEINYSVNPDSI